MIKKPENMIGAGIAIGVAIGVAIDNVGLGIALGLAIGTGMASKQKKENKTADSSSEEDWKNLYHIKPQIRGAFLFIKDTPTLLGNFCVIFCMKRLWFK